MIHGNENTAISGYDKNYKTSPDVFARILRALVAEQALKKPEQSLTEEDYQKYFEPINLGENGVLDLGDFFVYWEDCKKDMLEQLSLNNQSLGIVETFNSPDKKQEKKELENYVAYDKAAVTLYDAGLAALAHSSQLDCKCDIDAILKKYNLTVTAVH